MKRLATALAFSLFLIATYDATHAIAQEQDPAKTVTDELNPNFKPPVLVPYAVPDYEKRVEMIPMRDGVKLYTVIVIPKGAHERRLC